MLFEKTIQNRHNPYFNRWFSAINDSFGYNSSFQDVTILILIDGFLQSEFPSLFSALPEVTILILIDGFLQYKKTDGDNGDEEGVTILILIDGFLQ